MSSIEYLFNELWNTPKDKFEWCFILNKAKEMHKQEIIDTYLLDELDSGKKYAEQYYQETFVSKGSDKHKEKLKKLYPDAFSILGEVLYKKCQFEPTPNTSSATICANCGREKFLHKI